MQNYCITIPTQKYIKKYFTSVYGNPIELSHSTEFGDTILTKLSSKPLIRLSKENLDIAFRYYNDELKLKIPFDFFYRIETNLTDNHILNINRYLKNSFDADLFIIVNVAVCFYVKRKNAIEAFSSKHNILIDEDITMDALIKNESRYRSQKTLENNFLVQLSRKNTPLALQMK